MKIDKDMFYDALKSTVDEHHAIFARLDWMTECNASELLGSAEANLLVSTALEKLNVDRQQNNPYISEMILMLPGIIKDTRK